MILQKVFFLFEEFSWAYCEEVYYKIYVCLLEEIVFLDNFFDIFKDMWYQMVKNVGFENFRDFKFRVFGCFDYEVWDCEDFYYFI